MFSDSLGVHRFGSSGGLKLNRRAGTDHGIQSTDLDEEGEANMRQTTCRLPQSLFGNN
jgi:hypothetical protein